MTGSDFGPFGISVTSQEISISGTLRLQ